jgi:hypothetical protein
VFQLQQIDNRSSYICEDVHTASKYLVYSSNSSLSVELTPGKYAVLPTCQGEANEMIDVRINFCYDKFNVEFLSSNTEIQLEDDIDINKIVVGAKLQYEEWEWKEYEEIVGIGGLYAEIIALHDKMQLK